MIFCTSPKKKNRSMASAKPVNTRPSVANTLSQVHYDVTE